MRRQQRLRKSSQFAAVFSEKKSWANDLLALRAVPSEEEFSRFGFIVSKKVNRKAVARNKVRRRLREAARLAPVKPGWDVVIIARGRADGASYHDLESAMMGLFERAGLVDK